MELMRGGPHLILQDKEILIPGPYYGNHMVAYLLKAARDRVHHGNPGAAAHADNRPQLLKVSRLSQRADYVLKTIPYLEGLEEGGGFSDNLVYYSYRALLGIRIRHGKGDTLTCFIGLQDNKLAWFCLLRYERRAYFIKNYRAARHLLTFQDFKHALPP